MKILKTRLRINVLLNGKMRVGALKSLCKLYLVFIMPKRTYNIKIMHLRSSSFFNIAYDVVVERPSI